MYRFPHPSLGKCVLPFLSANYNNSNNNRKNEEKKSEIIFLFFEDQKLSRNLLGKRAFAHQFCGFMPRTATSPRSQKK